MLTLVKYDSPKWVLTTVYTLISTRLGESDMTKIFQKIDQAW